MIELVEIAQVKDWLERKCPGSGARHTGSRRKLVNALESRRREFTDVLCLETGYSVVDTTSLLDAAIEFVRSFQEETSESIAIPLMDPCNLRRVPWGRVLIALPSNAVLPLAVVLGLAFEQAGNTVLLSAPRNGGESMRLVAACFSEAGYELAWWSAGTRQLVDECIENRNIDCLYFVGGSAYFADISARCAAAGVELIFEGEGRGAMVVDASLSEEQIRAAARCLFDSKRLWGGRMCSAPNSVFVSESASRIFIEEFDSLATNYVSNECCFGQSTAVSEFFYRRMGGGATLLPRQTDLSAPRSPFLVWSPNIVQGGTELELFGLGTLGSTYRNLEELDGALTLSRFGLQLTVFTTDDSFLSHLISSSRVARVCVNMLPVNQNPEFAWGAYGRSGRSEVCSFSEKAYRKVIVESWDRPRAFYDAGHRQ